MKFIGALHSQNIKMIFGTIKRSVVMADSGLMVE